MTSLTRPLAAICLALITVAAGAEDWPSFRGPGARGVADGQDLPAEWDVTTGARVRFRTEIPGLGHSSPIVWGGRIFLTTAEAADLAPLRLGDEGGIDLATDDLKFTWKVLAVDALNGEMLWSRDVVQGKPRARRHVKSSQANATPATDGEVLATILGSEGLFVFDPGGNELWRAELGVLDPGLHGDPESSWGSASSPIIHQDRVIVQVDRHADSYLAAFDKASGRQLWKVARDERPGWATPIIHQGGERTELIVLGSVHTRGYDPATGRELWVFADEAEVKTPTPFVAAGRLILAGGYRGRPIHALPLGESGELTPIWTSDRGGPYTSTPVVVGEHVFSVANEGILNVWDLETGERLNRTRTGEHHSASIVASDGRLYLAGEGGEMIVVRAGRDLEQLARNDMGEALMATPAIAGGTLYVRSQTALYAIAHPETKTKNGSAVGAPAGEASPQAAGASQTGTTAAGADVTYLGNEGFLIAAGDTRIVIDGLFGDGLANYAAVPAEPRRRLESAAGEFAGVDLVLATHHHDDHFAPGAVARHLAANPGARFVSTRQAVDRLRRLEGFADLAGRVEGHWPPEGETATREHAGIRVTMLNLHHGRGHQPPVQNLGFLIEIGGLRLLHVGDTEVTVDDVTAYALGDAAVDVLFAPGWFFSYESWKPLLAEIDAGTRVVMHLAEPSAPANYFGDDGSRAGRLERIRKLDPEAVILGPMETRRFEATSAD